MFRLFLSVFLLFLVTQCNAKGETPSHGELANQLIEKYTQRDYWAAKGKYWFLTSEYDREFTSILGRSFGLNPGSPYGMVLVPQAPGEGEDSIGNWDEVFKALGLSENVGLRSGWHLREDEAIVLVGKTPPNAKYFSFTHLIINNPAAIGPLKSAPHFTETDSPINNKVIENQIGTSPYNQLIAVVFTASPNLAAQVKRDLVSSGLQASRIFLQRVSKKQKMVLGHSKDKSEATTFMSHNRVAYGTGIEQYLSTPPVSIVRIMPNNPVKRRESFPRYASPNLTDGKNEKDLSSALSALADAVKRKLASDSRSLKTSRLVNFPLTSGACLALTVPCMGTLDTNYSVSTPTTFGTSSHDILTVAGINHAKTGKSTYSNLTVYALNNGVAVAGHSDANMVGSIDTYLPYASPKNRQLIRKNRDKLYVLQFRRQCADSDLHCTEIALDPSDIKYLGPETPFYLNERAYLNPNGTFGPSAFELTPAFVIHSTPKK